MVPQTFGVFPNRTFVLGLLLALISGFVVATSEDENGDIFQALNDTSNWTHKLPVIYDSSSIDSGLQNELAKSVLLALRVVNKDSVQPLYLDLSKLDSSSKVHALKKCAKTLLANNFKVAVSLLAADDLKKFTEIYETALENMEISRNGDDILHIYTPRAYLSSWKFPHVVSVKSLQMSEEARAVALINRVGKVGVRTLIPVLDGDITSQFELLKSYYSLAKMSKWTVKFTKPILLNDPVHHAHLKKILHEHTGFHSKHLRIPKEDNVMGENDTVSDLKPGILLLATKGSQLTMKLAFEKNHLLMSWFSPNILEVEEWIYNQTMSMGNVEANRISDLEVGLDKADDANKHEHKQDGDGSQGSTANNNLFGLYTLNFVGSQGWDNPQRRRLLRELTLLTGPTPRIVSSVVAYDAAWLASDHLKSMLRLPKAGLSGVIDFDKGFRSNGTYLGTSAVPNAGSSSVTLLQPSTWILEDIISVKENGMNPQISDYDVATSSILTKKELLQIANTTRYEAGCKEHLMNIVTYDPFNQMPYHYFFNEAHLPESIVVPNHQGFGITFVCTHFEDDSANVQEAEQTKDSLVSGFQLACTPGKKMIHPINCFRSHVNKRQRRQTNEQTNGVPNVQYQYSFANGDPWNSQTQYANPKDDSQYYYQPTGNRDYQVESVTYGYPTTRLDVPNEDPVTPAPAPAPPAASKLPELRQILKAAKPFVGSCIGSSTGCAMCVLVLGRLPLGALPAACTGPCFVGTFGSCGSLLGRVFSETTVICTELFKQGLIDTDTFVADAEFGKYMAESSPYTMQGYTLMATPLVEVMKSSKLVTNIVATFAIPWARHMKYLLGRSDEINLTGKLVHLIGYPMCNIVGRIYFTLNNLQSYLTSGILFASSIFTALVTLALAILLLPNLRFSTTNQRHNLFHVAIILYTMTLKSKQILQTGLNYFKAIGRST